MAFQPTATLEPSTIEFLRFPAVHVSIDKGWITIVRINSDNRNIRKCVPETIESVETLQNLGLTHDAALEAIAVFALQFELTEHVNLEFIEWAKRHIDKVPDCSKSSTVST